MTKRSRVLFFSPVPYFKGGAERSLMDLVSNPSVDPYVLVPGDGPIRAKMVSLGVPTEVIDFGEIENVHRPFNVRKGLAAALSTGSSVRSLLRICQRNRIDIVHSNGLKPHVVSALARCIGGPPTVAHIRDIPFTGAEKAVWRSLRRAADRLILVSRACWPDDELPRNVVVIHNGVDIASIALREFHPASPLRIGFIGRIDAAKGLHLLLAWIAEGQRSGLEVRLIVRGRFDNSAYRDEIDRQIGGLGVKGQVDFQGFIADPEAVYTDIDVVCVPSHVPDPLPRSVMEPMARGIPVIAYPAGGILDMIEHRVTGFLAGDAAAFIAAVSSIQGDATLIREILGNARSRIETAFSLECAYRSLDKIYCDLA